tara:strand:+ start:826 stop:2631 length:1806 start_codon:yes stop_codon:yes gene_type:complete
MANYTVEDYRAAAKKAYAAGNMEAAEELAQAGLALQGELEANNQEDEIDTFGEYAGDVAGAAAAGLGRGAIGTLELPEMAARALARGGQEALQYFGADVGEDIPIFDTKTGQILRSGVEAVGLGDELDYRGQTTAGKFAGTIAEFAGGAGALGTAGKVAKLVGKAGGRLSQTGAGLERVGLGKGALKTSVAAGAASEAAGQATEGEPLEPYARIAGALAGPAAFSGASRAARKAISPYSGADEAKLAAAQKLEQKGVNVLAGQKVDDTLLKRQAGSGTGQQMRQDQIEQFTEAALKEIKSPFKRATGDALIEAQNRIGGEMNSAMSGIKAQASVDDLRLASSIISRFKKNKPVGPEAEIPNKLLKEVNKRLINTSITTGGRNQLLDAESYQSLRSQLSKQTTSSDKAVRDASVDMLKLLDGSVDRAMQASGRAEDFAKLQAARQDYRNYLAIEKSVSGAGEAKALGIIEPKALDSALRSQGARAYSQGRRGELGDLAKSGAQVLSFPNVSIAGPVAQLSRLFVQGAAGAAIGAVTGLPPTVVGALSAFGPGAVTKLLNTSAGQKYLVNQLVKKGEGLVKEDYARSLVSALASEATKEEDQQ